MVEVMTKKDYEAIARVLSLKAELIERTIHAPAVADAKRALLADIVDGLAEMFASENPRFSRERFAQACQATELV